MYVCNSDSDSHGVSRLDSFGQSKIGKLRALPSVFLFHYKLTRNSHEFFDMGSNSVWMMRKNLLKWLHKYNHDSADSLTNADDFKEKIVNFGAAAVILIKCGFKKFKFLPC